MIESKLPDHHGFIMMAVPYSGGDGRLKYVSSLKREEAIAVLREALFHFGAEEAWMKDIK